MDAEEQRRLVKLARQGDKSALESLYKECEPIIKSRARKACRQVRLRAPAWYDAEDLFQDAFLIFVDLVRSYDLMGPTPFHGYVSAVMGHRLIGHLHRPGGARTLFRPRNGTLQQIEEIPTDPYAFQADPDGSEPEPGPALPTPALQDLPPIEARVLAHDLFSSLPSPRHQVIVALAAQGYSFREIGELLHLSKSNVHRIYTRALEYMRARAEK
ncbi:MAG: RNA polymerase sigma factor [Anaerolineae bacterium]